jgi:streptomycin 6-kinase
MSAGGRGLAVSMKVPESVVSMQLAANGDAGRAWLAGLPRVIEEIRELWLLTEIGPAYEGGCVAFVAPAVRADGSRVVLKVSFVDEETEHEADALALWNGNGAVRLLDADSKRGSLLLEQLEPGTSLETHGDRDAAIGIACSLLRRLRVPAPAGHHFQSVAGLARRWADTFPGKYRGAGSPFAERLLLLAMEACERLATGAENRTLVNRDLHLGNILAARREPWLVIDPKPLVGDPAFDAGHLIRSLLPRRIVKAELSQLIASVARQLDLPPERIGEWVFLRSIDDALWAGAHGAGDFQRDVACAEAALP